MRTFVIDHPHNEASALLAIQSRRILAAFEWELGFWVACDEAPAHQAIAALGKRLHARNDDEQWQVVPLSAKRTKRSTSKPTDDVEALARAGSRIYVIGSHYGAKDGPLEPERHFVARFDEALVRFDGDELHVKMDVVRPAFRLHRLVNDALASTGWNLLPRGDGTRLDLVQEAIAAAKKWSSRVRPRDNPINVEGATFLPNGRLLLGLRHPVTAEGRPLMLELDGVDRWFGKSREHGDPEVTRVWYLENVGSREAPAGIRELDAWGADVHVVVGNLDSDPEDSRVLDDHPAGIRAGSAHYRCQLPRASGPVTAELVQEFDPDATVEGICVRGDGSIWYAHDDDQIRLQQVDEPGGDTKRTRSRGPRKRQRQPGGDGATTRSS